MSGKSRTGHAVMFRTRRCRLARSPFDTPICAPTRSCSMWISYSAPARMVNSSSYPKPNITNDPSAEPLLELAQNVHFGDLFELIMQGRLKNAHVEHSVTQ